MFVLRLIHIEHDQISNLNLIALEYEQKIFETISRTELRAINIICTCIQLTNEIFCSIPSVNSDIEVDYIFQICALKKSLNIDKIKVVDFTT